MKEPMRINGLRVDTQKIADGMYAIICEKGEEALVAVSRGANHASIVRPVRRRLAWR